MKDALLRVDEVLMIYMIAEALLHNETNDIEKWNRHSLRGHQCILAIDLVKWSWTLASGAGPFGSIWYVSTAVTYVQEWLAWAAEHCQDVLKLLSRLSIGQIDVSWECQVRKRPIYCQSSIGMNAAIESWAWSGRYLLGFSMMRSRHLAQSIERHLEYLFHLFAYLGKYQNAEMLYDPIVPCITSAAFQKQDWTYSIHYDGEG